MHGSAQAPPWSATAARNPHQLICTRALRAWSHPHHAKSALTNPEGVGGVFAGTIMRFGNMLLSRLALCGLALAFRVGWNTRVFFSRLLLSWAFMRTILPPVSPVHSASLVCFVFGLLWNVPEMSSPFFVPNLVSRSEKLIWHGLEGCCGSGSCFKWNLVSTSLFSCYDYTWLNMEIKWGGGGGKYFYKVYNLDAACPFHFSLHSKFQQDVRIQQESLGGKRFIFWISYITSQSAL